MKGNAKVIEALNSLLADELTSISQYMVHSEMCDSWGYEKLHDAIEKQAKDEMHHAETLIGRILFLDGIPIVSKLNPLKIGKTVPEIIENDQKGELAAIEAYNQAAKLTREAGDQATADLLVGILKMEEDHEDWGEIQRSQIQQMGLENYLTNKA